MSKNADQDGSHGSRLLWIPPVLALVLALAYLAQIRGQPFVEHLVANPLVYDMEANQILEARPPDQPFFLSPLYPAFVAVIYFFTQGSRAAVQVCQGMLLAINVWLVGLITSRLLSKYVALVASLLMVFYWSFYYFAGEILPTTLCITFLLAGILLFIRRDEHQLAPAAVLSLAGAAVLFVVHAMPFFVNIRSVLEGAPLPAPSGAYPAAFVFFLIFAVGSVLVARYGNLTMSGTLLGVSALVWSGTIPVIGLMALRLLFQRTARYAKAALFLLGVMIPIVASLSHNYLISGDIIPVTSSFGVNLFIGNNAATDGMDPFRFGEADRVRREADKLALAGAKRSAFYRYHALKFIKEDPGSWLKLVGRKILISIGRHEVDNNADISERRSVWTHLFVPMIHFGILFPLSMVGAVYSLRRYPETSVLVLGYVGLLLVSVMFFACERFRLPAIVFLLPLAALGTQGVLSVIRSRHVANIVTLAAVLIGAGMVSNIDLLGIANIEFPSIIVNRAYVHRLAGNLEEARRLSLTALEAEPRNAGAHFQIGAVEEAQGNLEGAFVRYLDSLEADPFFFASYKAAALILEERRISLSYLDAYVDSIIEGRDHTGVRSRLIEFVRRRKP